MTDDHTPQDDPIDEVDELDELLSAHLDAELELLEERPDLDDEIVAARLRELRGVADAVGASTPPVPAAIIDDQIATALQSLPSPADAPTSLTAARAAKRRPSRLAERLPALGAVAAFVLVLFGIGVVVTNLDGGEDSDDSGDAATEAADFRGDLDDDGEAGADADETLALESAPADDATADTEAPAEATADAGGDEAEGTADDDGDEGTDTTEAAEDTEATTAPASGEEAESALPIDLPEICTADLVSRLEADEVRSAVQRLDGTAEVVLGQGDVEITVIIDPGLCNGDVDPILPDQP